MTRRRWLMSGAGALVVVLLLVIGALALRPTLPSSDPGSTATTAPQPPDSETLFLPGHDPSPGGFTMTDPADAQGSAVSTRLVLEDGAARTGGTVGLSFDARELASPMWDSEDSNLALTLDELGSPALRFGGNGIDRHVWWTSSDEPAPEWAQATVTPEDLERVAAVAEDVDATVTIDLDLGHDDPARAADMAAHAQKAFGDRLLAVAIGNEPNGFFHANQPQLAVRDATWTPETYQRSLTEYSAALETAAPGLPVAGPGAYDAPWWRAFAESGIPNQRALSLHWYPLWNCEGPASSIANPTVEDLTSPAIRERARSIVGMGAEVAEQHGLPLWMEETGPTSCPGANDTSRTHAQALWTVDYAMTLAELGVERTAFHSTLKACEGGAPMSPICARGTLEEPGKIVQGRTSYLALMMLGGLPEGTVLRPTVSGDGLVSVHAVLGDDGELAIMIVDLRDPSNGAYMTRPVEISAPEGAEAIAPNGWELTLGSRLSGESLDATRSRLADPVPVTGEFAGAPLARSQPLTVPSDPGTVTMLKLDAADAPSPAPSDGGGADAPVS
ncbi:hypothetical protein [Brachybacterium sp. GCM10030252]|uniref:hypothetical protein n=1 Tax=Brachybacterium sp. GCM10030252 TaxID=3273380 RepID=UPI0036221CBA